MSAAFEADLDPQTGAPRVRMNFSNGWSISIVLMMRPSQTSCLIASVAACPTGRWGQGKTQLLESEASPEEVAQFAVEVAAREALS